MSSPLPGDSDYKKQCGGDAEAAAVCTEAQGQQHRRRQQLTLVVLDTTYRKAKNMAKHFSRRIDSSGRVLRIATEINANLFRNFSY